MINSTQLPLHLGSGFSPVKIPPEKCKKKTREQRVRVLIEKRKNIKKTRGQRVMKIYLGWSSGINLGPGSVLILKVSCLIIYAVPI
jgi:hypothetical protein